MSKHYYENIQREDDLPLKMIRINSDLLKGAMEFSIAENVEHFIPTHWHRSVELSYILKGQVNLKIGNETIEKVADDILFVNSGVIHEVGGVVQKEFDLVVLLISYDFMISVFPDFDTIQFDLDKDAIHYPQLGEKIMSIVDLYNDGEGYDRFAITARLYEIMGILDRYYKVEVNALSADNVMAKKVITYIHEQYDEGIDLQDTAKLFHVSREYFSRMFTKTFGISYTSYVISYRLYQAYPDVINSDLSILEIAEKHGFPNSKSFIKHFKDKYDKTPGEYRKLYQEEALQREAIDIHTIMEVNS